MTRIGTPDPEPMTRVVVVDDEAPILKAWRWMLHRDDFEVEGYTKGADALAAIGNRPVDVVVVDVMMPGMSGFDVLERIKRDRPDIEVVVMTGAGSIPDAVRAMQAGAFDYLTKPFTEIEECINKVRQAARLKRLRAENRALRAQVDVTPERLLLDSRAASMRGLLAQIDQVARVDAHALVTGPSGAGKEVVAKSIHQRSARRDHAFVTVDCAALTDERVELDLLGSVAGGVPGTTQDIPGFFSQADGGTLYLDELGHLSPVAQRHILKVLESGRARPVGAARGRKVDVRVISGSMHHLTEAVETGTLHGDLFFQLKGVTLKVPPLSERTDDIPQLAYFFLRRAAKRLGKEVESITATAMNALQSYEWVGNLRELEHVIESALVFETSAELSAAHLPEEVLGKDGEAPDALAAQIDLDLSFREALEAADRTFRVTYLRGLMNRYRSVSAAARHAQMDRANFRRMLRRYDITDYPKGNSGS
jgi:DNA-binding NtrC family response regulator